MGKFVIINNRKCDEKEIAHLKQTLQNIGFKPGQLHHKPDEAAKFLKKHSKSDGIEYKDMSCDEIEYLMRRSMYNLNTRSRPFLDILSDTRTNLPQ